MYGSHYDGNDVRVMDVRDPRRMLSGVTEVVVSSGHAVVLLASSDAFWREGTTMRELGFRSPEEVPAYEVRSRVTDELLFRGPVRLSLT
jgi:tRNA A58 N-methylase Trm61